MRLAPRYEGPPVLSIDGAPDCQLQPVTRQRQRLQRALATLTDAQWAAPSRCAAWRVRDVVAHLVTVNAFWDASARAARNGEPTRMLAGFDPAASPPQLVETMRELSTTDVLAQYVATNESLLATLAASTDEQWAMPAESPVGHVSLRLMAQHALWDSWIHERDVLVPLGLLPTDEPDEVMSCLEYASAVSPLMGLAVGARAQGRLAIEATNPTVRLVLDVGDVVTVRHGSTDGHLPCLRGGAVALVESLSLRAAPDENVPPAWLAMLGGLRAAFDA